MINKPGIACVLAVLFLAAVMPAPVGADGYRNPPEGAYAIGAFGGHRAFADDANATIHNSANLLELDRAQVQVNTVAGYGDNTFRTLGASDETEDSFFAIPGFSGVVPLQAGKTAFGVSAYVPYGRSVDWGASDFFAQNGIPYSGTMQVMDLTPNFAVRLNKALSLGIGADIYSGSVEQRMLLVGPVAQALGLPSGARSKLTADGSALGFNAALAWKPTENQRLAATVRSPFAIDYSGLNRIQYAGTLAVKGTIDYPTIAALAYGLQLTDTFRIEANVEWLEFSRYQELVIEDSLGGTTTTPQNLEDTWTAGVGAEWQFAPRWAARAGFMALENPTPDETYSPLGPDEDQEVISLGLGYENDRHALDLGYAYGLFDGRTIRNSVNSPPGKYDFDMQLLSLTYGYTF